MRRFDNIKKLDKRTRNVLRAILSSDDDKAISKLTALRSGLGKAQVAALETVLTSSSITRAYKRPSLFPARPPFEDNLQPRTEQGLLNILRVINDSAGKNEEKLKRLIIKLSEVDRLYAENNVAKGVAAIADTVREYGWSHTILRKLVAIRESLERDQINGDAEFLLYQVGIKGTVASSLIHSYSRDQSVLMVKRSILNFSDRGVLNLYTRTLAKISVQPFAHNRLGLSVLLQEAMRCSLIDAVILAKFNRQFFNLGDFEFIENLSSQLGSYLPFDSIAKVYDSKDSSGEYHFYQHSSAWLEYDPIRNYRMLIDNYYDAARDEADISAEACDEEIRKWVGDITLPGLVGSEQYTKHQYPSLAALELSGTVTRSALFNYWLTITDGQIGFEKDDLFTLMGRTRDLARTVPISAVRNAAILSQNELVKLILLLLLGKRSKNERDSYLLRKQLEKIATQYHDGSLVSLVKGYEISHPYVAEYIYEIATEDFLAKLTGIAPHRADIPEIRASLHEWMAQFKSDEHYLLRARAVRIDHQINRVRNEIDDHRIYVDPSRFSSWIEDEMMLELTSALTSSGSEKKGFSVTFDETVLQLAMMQCYNAFCSNPVFGIASYIGRRIRHGTFHGHLYSSVVNAIEKNNEFTVFFANPNFQTRWAAWKDIYSFAIEEIISQRLHVQSRAKPLGLLTPEIYGSSKQEVLGAAVKNISNTFIETGLTADVTQAVIDYCWRLAEVDLGSVTRYLKAQQTPLKNLGFLDSDLLPIATAISPRLADRFRRELEILVDRKLYTMYGWFKRPSIVAPTATVSLLFAATVAEVRDKVDEFDPQEADTSEEEIELVGGFYHLIYDSLAIVVGNAASYADRNRPLKRKFHIVPGKEKRLVIEIISSIRPNESPAAVSAKIEERKRACYEDANLYDKRSGISKLKLLESSRSDFMLDEYTVVGDEVHVRLVYVLEH